MKSALLLLFSSFVVYGKSLECGISRLRNDQFKKVVAECAKDNQTQNKIWDLASNLSIEDDGDSSDSSDEDIPITRGIVNTPNTQDVKLSNSSRSKRSRDNKRFNDNSRAPNVQINYNTLTSTTTEESTTALDHSEENNGMNNVGDSDETCIIQCIFEKFEMTDSNGLPDHKKVAAALLQSTTGRETRDFLQEYIDECFQEVDKGDTDTPCDYSTELVTCLAEKGKSNCGDWPTGNLLF